MSARRTSRLARALAAIAGAGMLVTAALAGTASAEESGAASADEQRFVAEAAAAGLSQSEAATLQTEMDRVLGSSEGGTQISANQVAWDDAVVTVPLRSGERAVAANPDTGFAVRTTCDDLNLCAWDLPNGQGVRVDLFTCGTVNVVDQHGLEAIRSFINSQSPGTVSTMRGPDPANPEGPWIDQYQSVAKEFVDNDRGFFTPEVVVC